MVKRVATKTAPPALTYGTVPRNWAGATVVCIATGPSLLQSDVDACQGHPVVAIKDAITMAPWADVLYSCGQDRSKWWQRMRSHPAVESFKGHRFTLDPLVARQGVATLLKNSGESGIDTDPGSLRTGRNSGYQAINIAVHMGAAKIVLLGYDMKADVDGRDHFFGAHPTGNRPPYDEFLRWWPTIVEPLQAQGVTVVNATRSTALDIFPKVSLSEALS
jgi:hypothetical protein